jgi:hypothetical protein
MAVRLSALRAGRPLPPGRFLVLISVRGLVDSRAIVRLEGLGQLKNLMTSSGLVYLFLSYLMAVFIVSNNMGRFSRAMRGLEVAVDCVFYGKILSFI